MDNNEDIIIMLAVFLALAVIFIGFLLFYPISSLKDLMNVILR
ncbi:hypothetical protein ACN9TC_09830 [Lactococcus lactis]|nr:hypothetical protein [Lactococcus lactis]